MRRVAAAAAVAVMLAGCGARTGSSSSASPAARPESKSTVEASAADAAPATTVPVATTTTTTQAPVRAAVAAGHPLVIADAGNSILFDAEPAIGAALGGVRFVPHTIGGFGVSVTPEVWQGVFGHDVLADAPAVVVVLMGNRDFQAALQDPVGYQASVNEAVRLVTATGTRVLWLGLPPLPPSATDEAGRRAVNAIYAQLPAQFPGLVRYVSTDDVLGAGGVWARSLPTDGTDQLVRKVKPDGTPEEHLCQGGAVRVAELVRNELASMLPSLPAAPAGWQQAGWRAQPRYDDPPGACRS